MGHLTPPSSPSNPSPTVAGQPGINGPLGIDVSIYPPAAVVRLRGELTAPTLGGLAAELTALITAGCQWMTVDLTELCCVTPLGVGVLNRAARGVAVIGGSMAVTGLDKSAAATLRRCGLDDTIYLRTVGPAPAMYPSPRVPAVSPPTRTETALSGRYRGVGTGRGEVGTSR